MVLGSRFLVHGPRLSLKHSNNMNIVFFGSSDFAVPCLRELSQSGYLVSCVVTQPDRKKGRGMHLASTQVKTIAQELKLKLYQPQNINSAAAVKFLKGLDADLFIVVAYGQILSEGVLEIPKIFSINAHASLLPKYRGAAPISWSLINGDKSTGVSIIKLTRKMDAGPLILQKSLEISHDDNSYTLGGKLAELAAGMLKESLRLVESDNYKLSPQAEEEVSFAPKLKKADGLIDWGRPATQINNLIRGCFCWPGAFTCYKNKLIKLYQAKVAPCGIDLQVRPGEVTAVSAEGVTVACAKDALVITRLQPEGKRVMDAKDFISGHQLRPGDCLGK